MINVMLKVKLLNVDQKYVTLACACVLDHVGFFFLLFDTCILLISSCNFHSIIVVCLLYLICYLCLIFSCC